MTSQTAAWAVSVDRFVQVSRYRGGDDLFVDCTEYAGACHRRLSSVLSGDVSLDTPILLTRTYGSTAD